MSELDELTKAVSTMVGGFQTLSDRMDTKSRSTTTDSIVRWAALILIPLFVSFQTNSVQNAEVKKDIKSLTEDVAENKILKLNKGMFYQIWNQHIANSTYNWKIIDNNHPTFQLLIEEKQ